MKNYSDSKIIRTIQSDFWVVIFFVFYIYTVAPTIGLGDTALLLDGIQVCKINTHVNNHNITVLLGWLFSFLPSDNIAFKGNLMSAFAGGLAITFYYALIKHIFQSTTTALVSALFLMVSYSMWWHSTIVECYAVNAIFTVIVLYLLASLQNNYRDKTLYWLFFTAGLSVFNHVQMGIIAIGAATFLALTIIGLLFRKAVKHAAMLFWRCSLSFFLGFLPYLITFIKDVYLSRNFKLIFSQAFGGDFKSVMFKGNILYSLKDVGVLSFLQFPSPFLLCIPVGLVLLWRRWRFSKSFIALLVMFLVNTCFFMFYNTWDKFAFLLPSFVILAFWGAYGIQPLLRLLSQKSKLLLRGGIVLLLIFSLGFPIYFYSHISTWAESPQSIWHQRFNNLYTENSHRVHEYVINPNKRHYYDIEEFATLLFEKLPANAIYIDDDSRVYYPIDYYQKYYHKRPDISVYLINSWGFEDWGLSKAKFQTLLKYAYTTDKDLFLISTKHPFDQFLYQPGNSQTFAFSKFQLDRTRWIYKLVTQKEETSTEQFDTSLPSFVIHETSSLLADVEYKDVVYFKDAYLVEQNMLGYGQLWKNNNHLFVGAISPGAEVAFLVQSARRISASMKFVLTTAPDFGMVDIWLNDSIIAHNIDLYTKDVSLRRVEIEDIECQAGLNELKFVVTGKNSLSSSYKIGIDYFEMK